MQKIIYTILIFSVPLVFWTLTANFFGTPKLLLLVATMFALVLSWAANVFFTKSVTTSTSPLRFALFAYCLVIILNLIINPSLRLESIIGPGIIYLSLSTIAYFLTVYGDHKLHLPLIAGLVSSTTILATHTLLQITVLHRLSFLPSFMQSRGFTLAGSPIHTLVLLLVGLAVSIYLALKYPKFKSFFIATSGIHTVSVVALAFLLMPGSELALNILPLRASWNIALDAMKSARTLFLGIGLSQFPNFFQAVKPLYLNSTPFWSLTPISSSSELLQILTTSGLFGLFFFIVMPLVAFKSSASSDSSLVVAFRIVLLTSLLGLTFTPASLPLLLFFFVALGVLSYSDPKVEHLTPGAKYTISGLSLAVMGYFAYFSYLFVMSEYHLRQAQVALSQNDAKSIYERHLSAIKLLPRMTSYHLSYSQVNLSLAGAISQKKTDLTDSERQNISQLISQAIREGKLVTQLNPGNSQAWQNLGSIYRNVINVADGADKFAIEAYAQAVTLDPGNAALRIEYGGLLYQVGQTTKEPADQNALYGRAQSEFQTAIQLKSDYPNAYYNLAKLLETEKDFANAYLAMQKTVSLLGPDSPDLTKATADLTAIQAKVPKASPSASPAPSSAPAASTTLSVPSPLPSPISGGPIDLP